jgi:hypothetical protein
MSTNSNLLSAALMPEFRQELERVALCGADSDVRMLARVVGMLIDDVENLSVVKLDNPEYFGPSVPPEQKPLAGELAMGLARLREDAGLPLAQAIIPKTEPWEIESPQLSYAQGEWTIKCGGSQMPAYSVSDSDLEDAVFKLVKAVTRDAIEDEARAWLYNQINA